MRTKIVAGNWKMNKTLPEATELVGGIIDGLKQNQIQINPALLRVILAPPFPFLHQCYQLIKDVRGLYIAAQNCSTEEKGAYTGEVSVAMLQSVGVRYVIIGHSERRTYFNETAEMLTKKIEIALRFNLTPIFCIGELLSDRKSNNYHQVVRQQLNETVFKLRETDFRRVVIAYEPVWAIGTGLNATPEQAQEMHSFIRQLADVKFGRKTAQNLTILYGGSCNAQNARELFAMPDVDGGLIGGASLKADDFIQIIQSVPLSQ